MTRTFVFLRYLLVLALFQPAMSSAEGTVPWLRVEGPHIKDPDGNVVRLKGVSIADPEVIARYRDFRLSEDDTPDAIGEVLGNAIYNFHSQIVRIPVHPEPSEPGEGEQHAGWFTDPDAYFANYLDPAVSHALERGAYVIIDLHYISDYSVQLRDEKIIPFWDYVAPRYRDVANVIFEIFNEPMQPDDWDVWLNTVAQPVVDRIRTHAPQNLIIVGGPRWSQNMSGAATNPVQGVNIAYAAHVYPQHPQSSWNENFGALAAKHPVVVTEWGYEAGGRVPTDGTTSGFGTVFLNWMDERNLSWTAFAFDTAWQPRMFYPINASKDWVATGGEDGMGEFVRNALSSYVWIQPLGTAVGTPNWRQSISLIYDANYITRCQLDEVPPGGDRDYTIFPYNYFGVDFQEPIHLEGLRFRNGPRYNQVAEFKVWALPPDGDQNREEDWVTVVEPRSSRMQRGWVEAIFETGPMLAKQVRVLYTKLSAYAPNVAEIEFAPLDTDGDGVTDSDDNCTLEPNGPLALDAGGNSQLDTNGDGYGNLCDPDFNNNGVVDAQDFSLLKSRFGQPGFPDGFPDQDLNGNGTVDAFDFSQLKASFGQLPGPSGLAP